MPQSRPSLGDALFRRLCQAAGVFVLVVAAALVAVLVAQSWPVLKNLGGSKLLTSTDWNPDKGSFGALVFVYGTVVTAAVAMLVAVPLGIGAAAYLSEVAPARVRKVCAFLLELLAAIPSVVYGFWAVEFLARRGLKPGFDLLGLENTAGQGLLAAGLVLAVMVLPYITAVSFDVLQAVPRSQREGALALGSTRWQTIWRVVLPYARPGVVAACFLALGRAVGETMAVTMVIGNANFISTSIAGTGNTIPSVIANSLPEAFGEKRAALVAMGLLLLVVTLLTNVAARLLIRWAAKPKARAGRKPIAVAENGPPPPPRPAAEVAAARAKARRTDRLMRGVLAACQLATVVPLFLILGYIAVQGVGGVNADFFTKLPNDTDGRGLAHAFKGSAILVGLAAAFAVPVGILAAVFLAEYRDSRLVPPIRFVAELLGGVPSIVLGIFAYAVIVYPVWLDVKKGYFSAWAGAFALGVMMLPVVIRASEEAMRLVPNSLREASYALGASRWQTVVKVVLPASLSAIVTGIILATARIAGETAPLILTVSASNFPVRSLSEPTPFVPYYIYNFAASAVPEEVRIAWAAALVLVVLIVMLNVGVRLLAGKRVVAAARAD